MERALGIEPTTFSLGADFIVYLRIP